MARMKGYKLAAGRRRKPQQDGAWDVVDASVAETSNTAPSTAEELPTDSAAETPSTEPSPASVPEPLPTLQDDDDEIVYSDDDDDAEGGISDDETPEAISLSTARESTLQTEEAALQRLQSQRAEEKRKRRERDQKLSSQQEEKKRRLADRVQPLDENLLKELEEMDEDEGEKGEAEVTEKVVNTHIRMGTKKRRTNSEAVVKGIKVVALNSTSRGQRVVDEKVLDFRKNRMSNVKRGNALQNFASARSTIGAAPFFAKNG
ncbi:hypothetical protein BC832DRAFT_537533 [Gaertneriomyces semiglobifer]|nr:hypothetical protein BC832DRAFT_537533 [Gaertneriomyces semiglobifer]